MQTCKVVNFNCSIFVTVPAGPPRNLEVLLMSNVSVTLSWDPPSKAQRRGRITKYKISVVPPLSENIVVPAFSEEGSVLVLTLIYIFMIYQIKAIFEIFIIGN